MEKFIGTWKREGYEGDLLPFAMVIGLPLENAQRLHDSGASQENIRMVISQNGGKYVFRAKMTRQPSRETQAFKLDQTVNTTTAVGKDVKVTYSVSGEAFFEVRETDEGNVLTEMTIDGKKLNKTVKFKDHVFKEVWVKEK